MLIGEKKKEYLAAPKETLDNIVFEIDELTGMNLKCIVFCYIPSIYSESN
ncbi:hypothetical protein [Paucisalibacillus globulus]|nr:hypothetical protein [Paucisalibacillus globulus]